MNNHELQVKVHSAMYTLIKEKGVASPFEILMAIGVLSKEDYENWLRSTMKYGLIHNDRYLRLPN